MALADFPEDDRVLVTLALRAGIDEQDACRLVGVDRNTLEQWLEAGRADLDDGRESDAAKFARDWDRLADADVQAQVMAANKIRSAAREDPAAAMRYLREMAASREVRRARELTAGT